KFPSRLSSCQFGRSCRLPSSRFDKRRLTRLSALVRTFAEHSAGGPMFFRFPPDARWNSERSVVEFGIGVGEYEGVVRVSRRVFQILLPEAPTPERCLEAFHLHRTRLELVAERKVRRRQLTDDGNIEITGRDLRERTALPFLENSLMPTSQITVVTPERWPHTSGSDCYG